MYNVIRLELATGQDPTVVSQTSSFAAALEEVVEAATDSVEIMKGHAPTRELRPLVNHGVAALRPYGSLQSWELRVDGQRTALLAIQEEVDA
jgi:hypothetical protein